MKVGIIGCGYVFDHYMATISRHKALEIAGICDKDKERANKVAQHYKLKVYASNAEMYSDPEIVIICNFTSIESHFEVTKSALMAGKHVYSEKPLTLDLDQAKTLFSIAEKQKLILSCAPSNALSDTMQTLWKSVKDGTIGTPKLIYAEFDDNPIYLMKPEGWRSATGAPWPHTHEYEMGCTIEHVGYHLTWLCYMFGPVKSVTSFSKCLIDNKTDIELTPKDTPDFSVACLNFQSGVVARVTCSIVAPLDHRIRVVGDEGMLSIDTYRDYESPVRLERFSALSLNARKSISVQRSTFLQKIFGIGGTQLPLIKQPLPASSQVSKLYKMGTTPSMWFKYFKRRQMGIQDKCIGIAELIEAIETQRSPFPSHEFTLHLTELTLAIQNGGENGTTHKIENTFAPFPPRIGTSNCPVNYKKGQKASWLNKLTEKLVDRLHKH